MKKRITYSNNINIDLHIPEPEGQSRSGFDSRPHSVDKWIKDLPLANIGETARLIYAALLDINCTELPIKQRSSTLDLLNKPISYIVSASSKHYTHSLFPLSVKSKRVVDLICDLHSKMATGYKIIIADMLAKPRPHIERLAIAIHRSLLHLSKILITNYQIYQPIPATVWKDIHQLYYLAELAGLLTTGIKTIGHNEPKKTTINDLYKQMLLISIANPYRLSQTQVRKLYDVLLDWSKHCKIINPNDYVADAGKFIIHLDRDEQTSHLIFNDSDKNGEYRILDTSGLADTVRSLLAKSKQQTQHSSQLSQAMLKNLMLSWGLVPKRGLPRARKQTKTFVTLGLSSTHHFISLDTNPSWTNGTRQSSKFQAIAKYQGRIHKGIGDKDTDVWKMIYPNSYYANNLEEPLSERNSNGLYETHICSVSNENAGGMCIRLQDDKSPMARIGELVGIKSIDHNDFAQWSIGVIRWMKNIEDNQLDLGIQQLAISADPVALMKNTTDESNKVFHRGLIIPEIKSIQQCATLLTPSQQYNSGDTVILDNTLNNKNGQKKTKLIDTIESTQGYSRFSFTTPESYIDHTEHDQIQENERFSTLWASL